MARNRSSGSVGPGSASQIGLRLATLFPSWNRGTAYSPAGRSVNATRGTVADIAVSAVHPSPASLKSGRRTGTDSGEQCCLGGRLRRSTEPTAR